jgi:sugar/nucleoside kinase (ribokinase family)
MTRHGVVTGGTWCVDHNLLLDTWPQENGRADILSEERCGGGPGYNLAVDLLTLDPGIAVETIGLVGDDDDGRFLHETARQHGIGVDGLVTKPGVRTNYTLAFASQDRGQRTHISAFEASHHLTPDHFAFAGTEARLAHLGLPGIHDALDRPWQGEDNGWVAVLKKARAAGLRTNMELISIEPERIATIIRPCLPHLDLLVVNDHEIGGIAGIETVRGGQTDAQACREAAARAMEAGTMDLVAVHFPGGAVALARSGETVVMPSVAVPPEAVKGANGAGDAFAAGFVYGWHEGWPLHDCVTLAHAVAAASLRSLTTTGAIQPWRDCLALAERWGWRAAP